MRNLVKWKFGFNALYVMTKTVQYFDLNCFGSIQMLIPQIVGFSGGEPYKVRNFCNNLQSEEEAAFNSNSSDCRIYLSKN